MPRDRLRQQGRASRLGNWDRCHNPRCSSKVGVIISNPIVTDVDNSTRVKKWIAQVLYKGRSCELTVDSEEGFLVNMIRTIIMMENFGDYDS